MEHKDKSTDQLVMLVDDCSVDNFINDKMIRFYGFSSRVMTYKRSIEAFEYLEQSEVLGNEVPAYIFLDLNMPKMNGHEFVRRFEKLPFSIRRQSSIIILSSSINPADTALALRSDSVCAYLSKPLIKKNIDELIGLTNYRVARIN
jgi:CheY-like chemotaxis protein